MNVLILSSGTRNKVVRYFKEALVGNGKVVATDMSPMAPSVYEADAWYRVPKITEPGYIDVVLNICQREGVDGVVSLIDPELSLLAENEERFIEAGVTIIGSGYEPCERSLDKMQMYEWLSTHRFRCARSYDDFESFEQDYRSNLIDFPVFAKPVRGSASIDIGRVNDAEHLRMRFEHEQGLMVQELLDGQEIGVDAYVDMVSGEVVSVFAKRKLVMRAGETDKAISFKDPKLFELIERLLLEGGYKGPVDIDVFDVGGEYYVSEVNPRFGGGYPHAHECGCNHVACVVRNLNGKANERRIGEYREGIAMMKYCETMIRDIDEF